MPCMSALFFAFASALRRLDREAADAALADVEGGLTVDRREGRREGRGLRELPGSAGRFQQRGQLRRVAPQHRAERRGRLLAGRGAHELARREAQIQKRARGYEQQMKLDYLQGLNDKYENWIKDYKGKLLIVEGDRIKFGENPEDFRWVTDRIDAELFGLFPFESDAQTGKEI